jgi:hypothetical protein
VRDGRPGEGKCREEKRMEESNHVLRSPPPVGRFRCIEREYGLRRAGSDIVSSSKRNGTASQVLCMETTF